MLLHAGSFHAYFRLCAARGTSLADARISKDTQLEHAALSTCERAGLLSLVCIYPMQFVVKEQNAAGSSARHEALSNITPEGACSKVSLFHGRSSPLSIGQELVELIGIEPMTPCLQSRCSPS